MYWYIPIHWIVLVGLGRSSNYGLGGVSDPCGRKFFLCCSLSFPRLPFIITSSRMMMSMEPTLYRVIFWKGFKIPMFKIPMFKIPMNQNTNRPYQNTNRPYQNTNGPYQNTNKHYQNTNNAFSKYQRRKFIIPTLKFIISKYQQPYQNTNRPYDHVQNTNTSNSPFQNTNSPTKIPTDPMIMFKIPTDPMIMFKIPTDPMKGGG